MMINNCLSTDLAFLQKSQTFHTSDSFLRGEYTDCPHHLNYTDHTDMPLKISK